MKRLVIELDDDCAATLEELSKDQGRYKKAVIQNWLREEAKRLARRQSYAGKTEVTT